MLLILLSIIRIPLSLGVIILRPIVPFFKHRLNFERKNLIDEASLAFTDAHYCFEVSSEGELEQVRPLIEAVLKKDKRIEILYSSPSVETKCQHLYQLYPDNVRVLRMPLLSGAPLSFLYFQSIWSWVSAPVIVFCRYDFFPELLLLKFFKKKFVLVSGAFKKTSWYKISSFKFFDIVIAATEFEKKNFEELLDGKARIFSCDFRVPRIVDRFQNADQTLKSKMGLASYLDHLKKIPLEQKIILGSAWPSDLAILKNERLISAVKSGKLHLLIAPHKLDQASLMAIKELCENYFGSERVAVVNEQTPYTGASVVILQMSGILCELYSLFGQSYVGGGYERSIHSVLEPFFSNNLVIVGPKVQRSTEFDLAFEVAPSEIHVLNDAESFYTIIESSDLTKLNLDARRKFRDHTQVEMKLIINEILN